MLQRLRLQLSRAPVWVLIIIFFLATRLTLSLIAQIEFSRIPIQGYLSWKGSTLVVEHPYLHIWAVWDSEWYLRIAEHGYSSLALFDPSKYSTIGFFPAYPATVSVMISILEDPLLASLIVSNLFLLISAFILYKLMILEYDEAASKRSLGYLFLFPSAYILSSAYPESMLLCAWLAAAYYSRRKIWLVAGLAGFLAAIVKPYGFCIFIPMIWMYLFEKKSLSSFQPISWKKFWSNIQMRSDIVFVFLPIVGLLAWGLGNYFLTGDLLAYSHVQQMAWYHRFSWPFVAIYNNFFYGRDYVFNDVTIILALTVLCFGFKKIRFEYWIFAFIVIIFNPMTGATIGAWRYIASIFPLVMILSNWSKSERANNALLALLALFQISLFVYWIAGYWFVS